MKIEIWIVINL